MVAGPHPRDLCLRPLWGLGDCCYVSCFSAAPAQATTATCAFALWGLGDCCYVICFSAATYSSNHPRDLCLRPLWGLGDCLLRDLLQCGTLVVATTYHVSAYHHHLPTTPYHLAKRPPLRHPRPRRLLHPASVCLPSPWRSPSACTSAPPWRAMPAGAHRSSAGSHRGLRLSGLPARR